MKLCALVQHAYACAHNTPVVVGKYADATCILYSISQHHTARPGG